MTEAYNEDCMIGMAKYPDKYFDLAVVDPPYGITNNKEIGFGDKKSGRINRPNKWGKKDWDKERPTMQYFIELLRISKNQVIWGGNYFADILPSSEKWLIWDKMQRVNQSDCELAYTSYKGALRIFQYHCSNLQGFRNPHRFHPTEKPIALYEWIYMNYLPNGGKVIDTHLGSGSNRIAADKQRNIDFYGWEIDKDYFDAQEKRFKQYKSQLVLQV